MWCSYRCILTFVSTHLKEQQNSLRCCNQLQSSYTTTVQEMIVHRPEKLMGKIHVKTRPPPRNLSHSHMLHCWWFRNPVDSPVEVGSSSRYLEGFIHPRCFLGISSINSSTTMYYNTFGYTTATPLTLYREAVLLSTNLHWWTRPAWVQSWLRSNHGCRVDKQENPHDYNTYPSYPCYTGSNPFIGGSNDP